ncbi:hypothetical protein M192_gp116 [Halorubrum tailed phage 8]|uniref:Uncharacterized protein n=2 Tax=Haloferacalesvirus TaxID=2843389 RepID=R4TKU9_9CAUD|nr:hypothetical protein M192_gp116 [Halorubrum tailed phage 8]AGM10763.1 hypothetical protein HRTV8_16 [Halorubrum tailed phage 8]UBF19088.1 SPP1 gp16-like head completion protein [Halorubrum phage HRTV-14]UBF19341.1 SPP1 gp16-like head completion protein [Halorubrum virus HRTV-19]UBF19470.1 SPP1 gp16-like head completion protein [Halorubrum virus HRTV-23]
MSRRSVHSAIDRLGKEIDVLIEAKVGSDEFNNPEYQWIQSHTTRCVRTYPNRNTELNNRGGPRKQDHPVFLFGRDDAPDSNARIRYDGTLYELESPTVYDTHVAIFGKLVTETE